MGIETKLNREWKQLFPHRNPKVWPDEFLTLANVMEREQVEIRKRLIALEKAARQDSA